jgi:hypothetical protein
MEFEFDKFVNDLEKRQNENANRNQNKNEEIDLDKLRRLRSERYHERWQNRIVWENK